MLRCCERGRGTWTGRGSTTKHASSGRFPWREAAAFYFIWDNFKLYSFFILIPMVLLLFCDRRWLRRLRPEYVVNSGTFVRLFHRATPRPVVLPSRNYHPFQLLKSNRRLCRVHLTSLPAVRWMPSREWTLYRCEDQYRGRQSYRPWHKSQRDKHALLHIAVPVRKRLAEFRNRMQSHKNISYSAVIIP